MDPLFTTSNEVTVKIDKTTLAQVYLLAAGIMLTWLIVRAIVG